MIIAGKAELARRIVFKVRMDLTEVELVSMKESIFLYIMTMLGMRKMMQIY